MASRTTTSALRVRDVMSRNPITVNLDTTGPELAETFDANDISGVPVVDPNGRLVGVVSKTDLIHRCLEGPVGSGSQSFFSVLAEGGGDVDLDPTVLGCVGDFMTEDPVTADLDEPIAAVARRMATERVHRVIVVDADRRPIGMVTTLDLLGRYPHP